MNLAGSRIFRVCSSLRSRGVHQLKVVKLNRTLLSLKGEETFQFLQGLISNDVRQFMNNFRLPYRQSIYSLLLQSNGRTLADFLLYNTGKQIDYVPLMNNGRSSSDFKGDPDQSVIVECDTNIKANLIKILKVYKLKKNLELSENNRLSVWCIYSSDCEKFELKECNHDSLILTADPRLNQLGYRCLSNESNFSKLIDQLQSINQLDGHSISEGSLQDYEHHRYRLGIGEGILDNPTGQCLPLEDNADLLNGLDFNKGCYLGQELVARTHYTGVVRKRLLPIEVIKFNNQDLDTIDASGLSGELREKVKFGITLYREDKPKKRLGKVRAISTTSNLGLGLVYHKELDQCNHLAANHELGLLVKVNKPIWWPVIHLH